MPADLTNVPPTRPATSSLASFSRPVCNSWFSKVTPQVLFPLSCSPRTSHPLVLQHPPVYLWLPHPISSPDLLVSSLPCTHPCLDQQWASQCPVVFPSSSLLAPGLSSVPFLGLRAPVSDTGCHLDASFYGWTPSPFHLKCFSDLPSSALPSARSVSQPLPSLSASLSQPSELPCTHSDREVPLPEVLEWEPVKPHESSSLRTSWQLLVEACRALWTPVGPSQSGETCLWPEYILGVSSSAWRAWLSPQGLARTCFVKDGSSGRHILPPCPASSVE